MKFIRTMMAALLLGSVGMLVGCGEEDDSAEATPVQGEDPEALRKAYTESGRYGPGGQSTPPAQGEQGQPAGGTSSPM
jgi:hypothetical protein